MSSIVFCNCFDLRNNIGRAIHPINKLRTPLMKPYKIHPTTGKNKNISEVILFNKRQPNGAKKAKILHTTVPSISDAEPSRSVRPMKTKIAAQIIPLIKPLFISFFESFATCFAQSEQYGTLYKLAHFWHKPLPQTLQVATASACG